MLRINTPISLRKRENGIKHENVYILKRLHFTDEGSVAQRI